MVTLTPVAFAPRRQQQAPEEAVIGTAGKKSSTTTSTAIWVLGLLAASTAITVAVCVPPPALHNNAYSFAISCLFFAGVAGIMSAVCCTATTTTTHLRHRHDTWSWRKLMHVLLRPQLANVGGGAAFSTTTALGVLGLAAASTAITVAVCVPPPALHGNAYFLAISCFFFAGVGGVMSAVYMAATTHLRRRHRHATGRKLMRVLLIRLGSVIGAAFSTKGALGMLGLAAVSTAMNLQQSVCQPHQPPQGVDESDCYYHYLAISVVFFAGVAGVMAAVTRDDGGQQVD